MIGAIIGDIVGSRFEFNNHRSTDFELFTPQCSFTDDTICTLAVARWCIDGGQLSPIMWRMCRKYPSSYGSMFQAWLYSEQKPYNSLGNGSAMRVSPVAWAGRDIATVLRNARKSAAITHNHPEGVKGAMCIADVIYRLRMGADRKDICDLVTEQYYELRTYHRVMLENSYSETCAKTVPPAISCFLHSDNFEHAIRLAVSIGGDTDTIAAITGSMAEAFYGVPEWMEETAMQFLPDEMISIINEFKHKFNYGKNDVRPVQALRA